MMSWLRSRPVLTAYLFAGAAYLLTVGLFRTPAFQGDHGGRVWFILLAVWAVALWAAFRSGLRGVLPLALLAIVSGFAWFATGFTLACAAYGDCL